MIRVAFVIGGYPPEEHKRRADAALSYSSEEVQDMLCAGCSKSS